MAGVLWLLARCEPSSADAHKPAARHRCPKGDAASNARHFTVSGFKVSGFKTRRPIRTPSFSTEPLPCVNCVPELAQDAKLLRQLCIVDRQNIAVLCQLCTVARLPAHPVDNVCIRPPRDRRSGLQGQNRGEYRNERHRHAEVIDNRRYQHGGGGWDLWNDSANRRGGPPAARALDVSIGDRWPS